MGQGSKFSKGLRGDGLGTKGGRANLQNETNALIKNNPLLGDLIKNGVKISPKDVIFTTKDKSGQVVWLEKGNTIKGLEHIKKHINDFVDKHNIQEKHLVVHLKNVITKGVIIHSQEKILSNGKVGLEKIYLYKGKYYTLGAVGTNGYIVSMYPLDGGK